MSEEKELTIEEMRSLISLATLLPKLLHEIETINNNINDLKVSFNGIKNKYNENTNLLNKYRDDVNTAINKEVDIKPLLDKLELLNKEVVDIKNKLATNNTSGEVKKNKNSTPVPGIEPKVEDKDKVAEIVDKILADHQGRKIRMLTIVDIKKGFNVDDLIAAKVLQWFEKKGMYNRDKHQLKFPKR